MMRNTTATKSSTPLMTITSPTPFRQGRPLTGKRELELRAQHPSGTPEWDSLSDWRQRLASATGITQWGGSGREATCRGTVVAVTVGLARRAGGGVRGPRDGPDEAGG